MNRETQWLWAIVVLGAALRLYQLGSQSLWNDEGLLYFIASGDSLATVLDRARWRTWHPPLSFMVHHLFLVWGDSDFLVRLPAAVFGIASLPLCYSLTKRLASPRVALCAVLILAVSPFHIWYSQEARPYSQMLFLTLLSSVIFLRAVELKGRWAWVFYGLVVGLGMYTHVLTAFAILGHVVWLLLYYPRRFLPLVGSGVIAVVLILPWVLSFRAVGSFVTNPERRVHAGSAQSSFKPEVVPYTFYTYATGFSLGPSVAELHENRSVGFLMQFLPVLLVTAIVFGLLFLAGGWTLWRTHGTKSSTFIWLGLLAPLAGAALFAMFPQGLYNVRYTILAFPYFCMIVGGGLIFAWDRSRLVGTVGMVGIFGLIGLSLFNHYGDPRYVKEDIKSAVAVWQASSPRNYLVSAAPGGNRDAINKYLDRDALNRHVNIGQSETVAKVREFFEAKKVASADVLLARDWHAERETAIRKSFVVTDKRTFPGVTLLRVQPPSSR